MSPELCWLEDHARLRSTTDKAKRKALRLLSAHTASAGCQPPLLFSEFGTRRRRSYKIQETVLRGLIKGDQEYKRGQQAGGGLAGTSNVSGPARPTIRAD